MLITLKLSWLLPKGSKFFDLLETQVANVLRASEVLNQMIEDYQNLEEKRRFIKDIEANGDTIARKIFEELNKTFITPIDSEDLSSLAEALDEVLDHIEGTSDRLVLYKVKEPNEAIRHLTKHLTLTAKETYVIISKIRNLSRAKEILEHCAKMDRLEHDADSLYRSAVSELFNSQNAIEILKLKEIYDSLEEAADKCQDVADVVEGIVVKNA